jgi:excisionase family DNA binding protein
LSTTQVSSALGVSVSTVKRWVEEGILPAQKTVGGHRKLLLADVLEVARREQLPTSDLSKLHAGRRRKPRLLPPVALESSLYKACLAGDADEVRAVILGAYQAGMAIEALADQVISPVMKCIGHDWETDRIDVMHEHRASELCAAALFELKTIVERRARRERSLAVGGAAEGDFSVLPTLLAQLVLTDAGWDAVNLGPNTPLASLSRAIEELRPSLVWLSISHLCDRESFLQNYRAFYGLAERVGVAVVIGGRALDDSLRSAIPYSSYGDGLSHLAAFARTLQRRPRRPRRGRPRAD